MIEIGVISSFSKEFSKVASKSGALWRATERVRGPSLSTERIIAAIRGTDSRQRLKKFDEGLQKIVDRTRAAGGKVDPKIERARDLAAGRTEAIYHQRLSQAAGKGHGKPAGPFDPRYPFFTR